MIQNQKVKITGGDYKNYSGKTIDRRTATEWLVDVNLGGGKRTRSSIDERFLEPVKVRPPRPAQVRGQGGMVLQHRLNNC